ncbi:MAG: hypothetical protein OQK73_07785 [Gammaproteobacteria bacterium]|nr:hypothetical protein [Gammaproteobacteria bacterium]
MLSFIYRLAYDYERKHGHHPNLLYLNREQFDHLCSELAEIKGLGDISQLLGMEVVLDAGSLHPHVYWSEVNWRHAIAV